MTSTPRLSFWYDPTDPAQTACADCDGAGCGGFGWDPTPDWCLLPATGHECGDCAERQGCRR